MLKHLLKYCKYAIFSSMVVSFFGHRNFSDNDGRVKKTLFEILEKLHFDNITFFIGLNGAFDSYVLRACNECKKQHENIKIVLFLAYVSENYIQNKLPPCELYDETLYPDIETVPHKLAIVKCNEWIVNQSDVVICFAEYNFGGAFRFMTYAEKCGKTVFNLADDFCLQ